MLLRCNGGLLNAISLQAEYTSILKGVLFCGQSLLPSVVVRSVLVLVRVISDVTPALIVGKHLEGDVGMLSGGGAEEDTEQRSIEVGEMEGAQNRFDYHDKVGLAVFGRHRDSCN